MNPVYTWQLIHTVHHRHLDKGQYPPLEAALRVPCSDGLCLMPYLNASLVQP